jgi:hypothetical protein
MGTRGGFQFPRKSMNWNGPPSLSPGPWMKMSPAFHVNRSSWVLAIFCFLGVCRARGLAAIAHPFSARHALIFSAAAAQFANRVSALT